MSPKMKRMQLYIGPELDAKLKRLAAKHHVSKASLLRQGAERLVQEEELEPEDSLFKIVAMGASEPGRISEEHDEYLIAQQLENLKG